MSRIRNNHPGRWIDDDFIELSYAARLLAISLMNFADCRGVFEWKPKKVKIQCFPADNIEVKPLLDELVRFRQIEFFSCRGLPYGIIRNFMRFQSPKKPSAHFPVTKDIARRHQLPLLDCDDGYVAPQANQADADKKAGPVKKKISFSIFHSTAYRSAEPAPEFPPNLSQPVLEVAEFSDPGTEPVPHHNKSGPDMLGKSDENLEHAPCPEHHTGSLQAECAPENSSNEFCGPRLTLIAGGKVNAENLVHTPLLGPALPHIPQRDTTLKPKDSTRFPTGVEPVPPQCGTGRVKEKVEGRIKVEGRKKEKKITNNFLQPAGSSREAILQTRFADADKNWKKSESRPAGFDENNLKPIFGKDPDNPEGGGPKRTDLDAVLRAAGPALSSHMPENIRLDRAWLDELLGEGLALEADILPAIRARVAQMPNGAVRSPRYFLNVVRDHVSSRAGGDGDNCETGRQQVALQAFDLVFGSDDSAAAAHN